MPASRTPVDPLFLSFQLAVAGRYSIDRELGRGGMGIVYLAREVHLDRLVAIKLLPPERARTAAIRERFLREARLAAKLSHPNIIPIHAVDETQEFVFYVMAYVDGETLAERVRTRGPLPGSEAARILRQVAWALSHAHAHGLIHRDVKPDNIMLEAGTGRVLVSDFGIASIAQEAGTASTGGTPEFMSPEQALGRDIDARSDLYALGATAFFAISGRLPFGGANATEVLAKHVTEPPPPLAGLGIPVPRKIALLVDRCLAKEPTQRPATADEVAEQLGLALEQRRELPAALRAFVKRSARLNAAGALLPFTAGVAGIVLAASFGPITGFGAFLVGTTAATFGFMINAARRLLRSGFTHTDAGGAFAAEVEQAREESVVEHGGGPSRFETLMKRVTVVTMTTVVSSLALVMAGFELGGWAEVILATAGIAGSPATLLYLTLLERRRDVDTEIWARIWSGRLGRAAFWCARKLLGNRAPTIGATHHATELALGLAADSLFASLPQATRRSLGNVPQVVERLQDDAHRLRRLYDDLQEAIASVGDAAFTDAYRDLRADRDRVQARLSQAVGALETIRLGLLRLHAGSGTVEALTTHIDIANDLAGDVERLIAARRDVERALLFPHSTAPTPA